jgi:ubiquinol-cytochrome c reductase cytochrome c subunit
VTALLARRRHPLATFVVLAFALVVVGGAYALLAPTDRARAATGPDTEAIEAGRALFLTNCSTCHGLNGEGTSQGPTLVGVGAASADFQVGTGRMPLAQPGAQAARKPVIFDDRQVAQIAAYVASLGPGPAIPVITQEALAEADIAEGGELYRTNCAMCHNFAAVGGALTEGKYAPSLKNVEGKYVYEAMITGPQSMPVFGDDSSLTPGKKLAIIAWLQAIEDQPSPGGLELGQIGPVSEGLVAWTLFLGLLIGSAVWLGQKAK